MSTILMQTEGLTKRFGGVTAVDNVSISIVEKQFRAIIGPNGAGKSTLFNLLARHTEPTSGSIAFDGRDISNLPVHRLPSIGIGRTFQKSNLFWHLALRENIRLAVQALAVPPYRFLRSRAVVQLDTAVDKILERLGMSAVADQPVATLSHGDQRLAEVAVALGGSPRLLLLDEPLAGMSPQETQRAVEIFKELAKHTTIILIEHDMDVVLHLAERITVLEMGRVIADGTGAEVQSNARVRQAYLGLAPSC